MLGADSPYVIKLLALKAKENEQGQLVGATFFWSTAGSIVGSIASGFWLIPYYGLRETVVGTAIFLVIFGICTGLLIRKTAKKDNQNDSRNNLNLQLPILIAILLLVILSGFIYKATTSAALVYETDGYYSNIKIFDGEYDSKPARFMKRDINSSSAVFLADEGLVYPYSQFTYLYPALMPEAKTFLVLGGGAYTIPREVHKLNPDMQIDVVEIEPLLYDLAIEYFDLPMTDKIINHPMDVRAYLARTEEKYDVVFVDAFSTGLFVPSHLVTQEFFALLKSRLSDEAIVIVNFIGSKEPKTGRSLTGSVNKTITSVFPNYLMFASRPNLPNVPQNLMYIIKNSDSPLSISDLPELSIRVNGQDILLSNLILDPSQLSNSYDEVLTDNNNPVEVLVLKERFKY